MTDFAKLTPAVAKHFWGEPNKLYSTRTEWRWGSKGSRVVDLEKGTWYDHEADIGGGCIALIEVEAGLSGAAAHKWLEQEGYAMDEPHINGSAPRASPGPDKGIKPKPVAHYDYTDDLREALFRVVRSEWPANNGAKPDKTFAQYRPDGHGGWIAGTKGVRRVPYRLADLLEAVKEGATIFIPEGEKKVDALWALDVPATCNAGGAKKWQDDWGSYFRNADVVLLPDNDSAGRDHVALVGARLAPFVKRLRVLELPGLPPKGDVVDWLEAGGTAGALYDLANATGKAWAAPKTGNGHDPHPPSWRDGLLHTAAGTLRQTHANIVTELLAEPAWEDVLYFNPFSHMGVQMRELPPFSELSRKIKRPPTPKGRVNTFPREITEEVMQAIWLWFQHRDYPQISLHAVEMAVQFVAHQKPYHPVRNYLESIQWDGQSRIRNWLFYYCGAEATTEPQRQFVEAVGLKWMVSAVARVMEPGCKADHVLILEGQQGIGKTSAFAVLGGEWFSDSLPGDLHSKDAAQHLRGKWIIEMAELSALSRSEVEVVKSFLSRQEERFRPPYHRAEINFPRQCVFAGSTNQAHYLKDETGGRRFWPVRCTHMDLESLRADRDQLWAEALYYYKQGAKWWFQSEVAADLELIVAAKEEQAQRYEGDPWQERVTSYCAHRSMVSTAEILDDALHLEKARQSRVEQIRVVRILTLLGYEKSRRVNNVRMWEKIVGTDADNATHATLV